MDRSETLVLGLLMALGMGGPAPQQESTWVEVPAGVARYQSPGSFVPVEENVPRFSIMRRQVSRAEYAACVRAKACAALDKPGRKRTDQPVVGISWVDATAYAAWLSSARGETYRLPHYSEWLLAVGHLYVDDPPIKDDPRNPARRWLDEYERDAQRSAPSLKVERFSEQSPSASGLVSIASNVWEWTNTCFSDVGADQDFCGIHIAAGRHPSALSDFVRDPVSGACSVGTPPTYVGLRLVRESR